MSCQHGVVNSLLLPSCTKLTPFCLSWQRLHNFRVLGDIFESVWKPWKLRKDITGLKKVILHKHVRKKIFRIMWTTPLLSVMPRSGSKQPFPKGARPFFPLFGPFRKSPFLSSLTRVSVNISVFEFFTVVVDLPCMNTVYGYRTIAYIGRHLQRWLQESPLGRSHGTWHFRPSRVTLPKHQNTGRGCKAQKMAQTMSITENMIEDKIIQYTAQVIWSIASYFQDTL